MLQNIGLLGFTCLRRLKDGTDTLARQYHHAIQIAYDQLPFGGAKQSGFGKEHGIEAIESYTEKKSVVLGSG